MKASSSREPSGMADRLTQKVKRLVRLWVDGPQIRYWDDPKLPLEAEQPTWPLFKALQAVPGEVEPVKVGKYTGIHYTTVIFLGGKHHHDWVGQLHAHLENGEWVNPPGAVTSDGPVVIGNDVFISFEAMISSGVTIGDGALVTPRSVVTRSVEPYSVVGGIPAKHIRYRFDQPTREALLRIRWWDWDADKVARHQHQIHSPDVAGFVAAHDPELGPPTCDVCA